MPSLMNFLTDVKGNKATASGQSSPEVVKPCPCGWLKVVCVCLCLFCVEIKPLLSPFLSLNSGAGWVGEHSSQVGQNNQGMSHHPCQRSLESSSCLFLECTSLKQQRVCPRSRGRILLFLSHARLLLLVQLL